MTLNFLSPLSLLRGSFPDVKSEAPCPPVSPKQPDFSCASLRARMRHEDRGLFVILLEDHETGKMKEVQDITEPVLPRTPLAETTRPAQQEEPVTLTFSQPALA